MILAQSPRRRAVDVRLGTGSRDALSKLGYVEGAEIDEAAEPSTLADPTVVTDLIDNRQNK